MLKKEKDLSSRLSSLEGRNLAKFVETEDNAMIESLEQIRTQELCFLSFVGIVRNSRLA